MKSGTAVLGRFELGEALPAPEGMKRWRAIDRASGEAVEVVAPDAAVLIRPGAADRFLAAARLPGDEPALLSPLQSGREDRLPVAVRAPVHPVARLPRLDGEQALALARWLAPAALKAEEALAGHFVPEDLVMDERRVVRIAPRGLQEASGVIAARPHRAPERADGSPARPGSALFGLGVMLFQATSGRLPASGERLRDVDPGQPAELDALLAELCSGDPERRRAAALRLPPGEPVVLPVEVGAPPLPSPMQTTVGAVTASLPVPLTPPLVGLSQGWLIELVAPPATEASRRRLAALLDVPMEVLIGELEGGQPLAIGLFDSEAHAGRRLDLLRDLSIEGRVVGPGGGWGSARAIGAGVGALTALATGVGMLLLGLVTSFLVMLLGAASLLVGALLAYVSVSTYREAGSRSQLESAHARLARLRRAADAQADPASRALRAARRAVLEAELTPLVRLDQEGLLDALEAGRAALGEAETVRRADAIAAGAAALHELAMEESKAVTRTLSAPAIPPRDQPVTARAPPREPERS